MKNNTEEKTARIAPEDQIMELLGLIRSRARDHRRNEPAGLISYYI